MKLKGLSEKEIIRALEQRFPPDHKSIVLGIGDDAAVVEPGELFLVVTKDLLIENTHFLADLHPAELLARKSLSVNLSDVAAMGCKPRYVLFGLALPVDTDPAWIDAFMTGLKQGLTEFEVSLVGGDVTRAEKITISVTVLGEGRSFITRSGAKDGDRLFVSGTLGDAALGRNLLRDKVKLGEDPLSDVCLRAFLDPFPQVELGIALSQAGLPSAMIDLSDGLSLDLAHICRESEVGAEVFEDKLPLSDALLALASDPVKTALRGGEDYQLLFSVPPDRLDLLPNLHSDVHLQEIGRIVSGKDIVLINREGDRKALEPTGFLHFRPSQD